MSKNYFFTKKEKEVINKLLQQIISIHKKNETIIIGIQGGQGTGKTTLAKHISKVLKKKNFKTVHFSIDDIYKSVKERKELIRKNSQNPFYQIPRGLPGTHQINLLENIFIKSKKGQKFTIPKFNKSTNKGFGSIKRNKIKVSEGLDFLIIEGWCLGIPTTNSKGLIKICNKNKIDLKGMDPELKFHKVPLKFIKGYQKLWKHINLTIMLKPDSLKSHHKWRLQQERELKKNTKSGMTSDQIFTFVNSFLPFTYLCYDKIKPDVKIIINNKHEFYKLDKKIKLSKRL